MPNKKKVIYATYTEAQAAALMLGIKSQPDYRVRYRQDPMLPCNPNFQYAHIGWTDWFRFLNKEKPSHYATYAEAQLAVQALDITNRKDYDEHYREDPKLPSNPNSFYMGVGWTNWFDFLGRVRSHIYSSYDKAKAAVKALGIKKRSEYKTRYLEDLGLPCAPDRYYAGAGWTDWHEFLGKVTPSYYATFAEAREAVLRLGIKQSSVYRLRYREDSKLPANPAMFYATTGWTNWTEFLGKVKRSLYTSYAEAQSAALKLGFKHHKDYRARYREDPGLPAVPEKHYANAGWTSWHDFLGNKKRDFYPTLELAWSAVQALGIKSKHEYSTRYREDSRLPSLPSEVYAGSGWNGWPAFLGYEKRDLYATYAEAQLASQALGIKKGAEYKVRYREDPRLPALPSKAYAGAGWTSWYEFLGNERPADASQDYPNISADINLWLDNETNHAKKISVINALLIRYFRPLGLPDDSRYLLFRTNQFNAEVYQQFIESQAETQKKSAHVIVSSFFKWVLNKYCTDTDFDTGESIVLPGCRNPFETVLAAYAESLQFTRPSQSTKPPLGYEYILRAREYLVPNGEQVLLTRPNLKDLPHLQDFFDSRADWMEVDESCIDRRDPNCVWRVTNNIRLIDGKRRKVDVFHVWSPVRFVALYSLLRYPLRGQQYLWLDSGETDAEIAVLDVEPGGIRWKKNTGPLVGKGTKKYRPQGVIQRGDNDFPKMYVTTNKTGRKDGGYEVDWVPEDLAYWFIVLRNWQSKYNPLSEPTPWLNVSMPSKTNRKILKARGTQTFLFRTSSKGQPLITTTAFVETLPKLLYKIQREGENLAEEVYDLQYRYSYSSIYTPHSLRVSLITAFIADGEAPIHLISKLVGHASLVMTIYYIKMGGEQIRRAMDETEKRAAQLAAERQAEAIRTQGLRPVRDQLIVTDGNRSLIESDVPNSACVVFDCGICPMSAASCHIGGEFVEEGKVQNFYRPVEAGYLGQKNCTRCRFFITGVPFLGGLVALANELSLEIFTESGRFQKYAEEVDRLEQEYYDTCQANMPDTQQQLRKRAVANMQQSGAKLDSFLTDFVAVNHYIQGCRKLIKENSPNTGGDEEIRLIAAGDLCEIGVAFEESKTQYHLLAEICQNATIYQSANPSRALPLIAQAIDRMAENNNLKPAMFRLADEEKLIVANELNRLLLKRLGSWERIDDLFCGDLMLLDIDAHEPQLVRISKEIQNLLSNGASRKLNDATSII